MRRSASRVIPPLLCACRDGILPRMSQSDVPPYTKSDGTKVRGHTRRGSAAEADVDDGAKQAAVVAAQQATSGTLPAESRTSDYIAEELKTFDLLDEDMDKDWGNACDAYLRHHALLEQLPDSHASVVHFRLRRMKNALETMSQNDGGRCLPYEYYAEGIARFQGEVEAAEQYEASADDPHIEDVPAGEPRYVPFYSLIGSRSFFSESTHLLSQYSGEGTESDEWRGARRRYISCLKVYESLDTHDAHGQFCVHRAQMAFAEMESEFRKRGGKDENAHEFYSLGKRRLADLKAAAEHATAMAPTQSGSDRRALARITQVEI